MKSFVVFSLLLVAVSAYTSFEGIENRIANGQIAQPKQLPYHVRIELLKMENGMLITSLCGGTLISNRTVLTAAHCLENVEAVLMFLGTTKESSNEPTRIKRGAWRSYGDFITHENFNKTSMENDIALISFTYAVNLNDAIKSVDLPTSNQMNLENRMAVIAGFGKTGTNAPVSKELRFANRRIVLNSQCQQAYPAYFKSQIHLCVDGSENISTCPGDFGGPLVIEENGFKTVVGLASFGASSCDSGYPFVFTKVGAYLDWIKKHMK